MKKKTLDLKQISKTQSDKVLKALSERPKSEVKKGVDLAGLAQNLAKRHVEKVKSSSEEEE